MHKRLYSPVKGLTFLLLLIIQCNVFGQNGTIIPPSPNIATMQRFGDYPVNLSTGLVDITIPLYEIKLKDYSFPVSIKFHASGRRWSGNYSSMGVGWSLDAGGFVSREIRERPDESYLALEMTADSITNRSTSGIQFSYDRLVNADMSVPNGHLPGESDEYKKEDPEHDMFTFGANGISGKFVIDKWGNAFPLTHVPYNINATPGAAGCYITDEQGTLYAFGIDTQSPNANSVESVYNPTPTSSGVSFITATLLSRIERPSGEKIFFNYNQTRTNGPGAPVVDRLPYTGSEVGKSYSSELWTYGCMECSTYVNSIDGLNMKDLTSYKDYDITTPKEIIFPNGKITFDYNTQLQLTGFHVFDAGNQPLQSGTFTYITTPGTSASLSPSNSTSLTTLIIKNYTNQTEMTYNFDYYGDALYYNSGPNTDWWGYSNVYGGNLPPYNPSVETSATGGISQSYKEPSFYSVRGGMLRKIYYPTGGTTEFFYELNQYDDGTVNPHDGPGLRIQKLITDDGNGANAITKLYKYGSGENGKGYLYKFPNAMDFKYQKTYHVWADNFGAASYVGDYTLTTFSPFPIASMSEAYQQPVYYDRVSEYTLSQNGDVNTRIDYSYTLPQYMFTGWSIRKKDWTGGELLSKSVYAYDQSGANFVESTSYGYSEFHYRKLPQVRIWRNSFLKWDDAGTQRIYERSRALSGESIIWYHNFPYESAVRKQTSVTHSMDNITTSTQLYYDDPKYIMPTRVVNTTSTGEKISEETQYVFDFTNPLSSMFDKNYLFPIETSTYRMNEDGSNKRLISSEYRTFSSANGAPLKVYRIEPTLPLTNFLPAYTTAPSSTTLITDSRYVEKYSFDQYGSKGNLLQEHQPGNLYTSYLWDDTYTYPIAQVKGASYSQVSSLNGKPSNYSSATLNASLKSLVPSAVIQTFSYRPLVGLSSQTDANGITTYYEYDTFGRLALIKDNDGNVIKSATYHYRKP